jgi:hypothetical protein
MRRILAIALFVLVGVAAATVAHAFVSASVNIAKENGYAILKPPNGDSVIAKENGYAILKPPAADAVIAKENGYAILTPPSGRVVIAKMNAYAIVVRRYPSVQIMQ